MINMTQINLVRLYDVLWCWTPIKRWCLGKLDPADPIKKATFCRLQVLQETCLNLANRNKRSKVNAFRVSGTICKRRTKSKTTKQTSNQNQEPQWLHIGNGNGMWAMACGPSVVYSSVAVSSCFFCLLSWFWSGVLNHHWWHYLHL